MWRAHNMKFVELGMRVGLMICIGNSPNLGLVLDVFFAIEIR
jgi:hypothetical protein